MFKKLNETGSNGDNFFSFISLIIVVPLDHSGKQCDLYQLVNFSEVSKFLLID